MDKNLSHERVATMFFGLAEEVWRMYDLPLIYFPDFSIGPTWRAVGMPKEAMAGTVWFPSYANSEVRVVDKFLPFLYEDEVICVLLHEIAHACIGQAEPDAHGSMWAEVAEEIGCVPEPVFTPRRMADYPWLSRQERKWLKEYDLTPTLGPL